MSTSSPFEQLPQTKLSCGLQLLREICQTLPNSPGVYRMIDANGEVLYIGKAKNLARRVTSYTQVDKLPLRLQRMVSETTRMEIVTTHTEAEALLLEANLIQKLGPKYNIIFRDNKTMAYIVLTKEPWPALRKHRGPRTDKGHYFGPFASSSDISVTLSSLHRAFLIRSCSDSVFKNRTRPCLQYHIKRCSAPCVNKVTPADYNALAENTRQFLSGKSAHIQQKLAEQMMALSNQQAYEQAAIVRDRIHALTQLQARQSIFSDAIQDADIIGVAQQGGQTCFQLFFFRSGGNYGTKSFFPTTHRLKEVSLGALLQTFISQFYQDVPPPPLILLSHPVAERELLEKAFGQIVPYPVLIESPQSGPKAALLLHATTNAQDALSRHLAQRESQKKVLQKLQEFLGATHPLERIEIYDNSHLQGRSAYGVMVVATPEGFLKKGYRKFTISDKTTPGDDYGMMREVFTRRFRKEGANVQNLPDLLLVDGGAGQLSVVHATLSAHQLDHIPLIAISKGPERNAGRETLHRIGHPPTQLDQNDSLLYYFQRLRDEAHRFAITTHRKKRTQALRESRLDAIPGIGKERKKMLLLHFGSLEAIKRAGVPDLCAVPTIHEKLAKTIYAHFQNHV